MHVDEGSITCSGIHKAFPVRNKRRLQHAGRIEAGIYLHYTVRDHTGQDANEHQHRHRGDLQDDHSTCNATIAA